MSRRKPQPVFPIAPDVRCVRFSFRYLDTSNPKFSLSECDTEFFANLTDRLKVYSSWPVELFRDSNNTVEHRHTINFSGTSEPHGFPGIDPEQFEDGEDLQFSVSLEQSCIGRVHGVLLMDTFYVVWLDKCHRLYPKPWSC
jgi:hypothetical protein